MRSAPAPRGVRVRKAESGTLVACVPGTGRQSERQVEQSDRIYLWKHLYWRAIQEGYEPRQAEEFANRMLASELKPEEPSSDAESSEGKRAV
jgi:hypothetical protein